MNPRYPDITVKLVEEDGNAYTIIGRVRRALRKADVPTETVNEFVAEATSGDYSKVLTTAMAWVEVQ